MRLKNLLSLVCILLMCSATAQEINVKEFKAMSPRSIGPAGMSGRVTSIAVNHSSPDNIYAGTASGGVWHSNSGGITWKPIFDEQPLQSIGAVAIQQSNPSVIWVGTGEGNPRNSHNSGGGIYKSLDGGKNWTLMGLKATKTIHRIVINKDNPDIVYVGSLGSIWGKNKERGVFKTTDGGKTWDKILYVNDGVGCADLVVDPINPNKLIAAMWEYGREPWFFNSGGKGSGMYITHDGGKTWKKRTYKDGLPKGNLGRIGIAIAPSKPNIIYALVEAKKNGLYKSVDGGFKWSLVSEKNIGNRPFYYAELYVDPQNENRIWNLWSYVSKSEDGGRTFKTILDYGKGVHPDHHAFWIHPDNPNYMINGNDGGLNISRDGGKNWRFIENMPVAQFYHINYDMDVPYNIYGGMQDNGSWVGPHAAWKRGGIRNADWREVMFGDGFDVVPDPENSRYGYAMWQSGNVARYDRETGQQRSVKPFHPEGEKLRFNWNAAIAQHPFNTKGLYFGSQYVHVSLDQGQSWEIISPDLTTNDASKQTYGNSGGLTLDVTGAENFTTLLAIAPSPVKDGVIWASTDDGNLQITQDSGKNWANVASRIPSFPKGAWIPQIEVSKKNAGEAFIVINDYRRNNFKPYAYHTTDYGQTFRRIANSSKVNGHVLSIVQDPVAENLLFLGTDNGLYFSINKGQSWTQWTEKYPSVTTADLKIHPRDHDLIVGTFGRAAYIFDDIQPLREIAQSKGSILNEKFHVFKPADAYLHNHRSVDGVRFTADANFIGDNERYGAVVSIWVKKPKADKKKNVMKGVVGKKAKKKAKKAKDTITKATTDKKSKKGDKKQKVKMQVFNMAGDTLRTLEMKLDSGLNRIAWRLDEKGIRFPSRSNKERKGEPGGMNVLPGKYKLKFTCGKSIDSTEVTVLQDPRATLPIANLIAERTAGKEFMNLIEKATKGMNSLKQAKKTLKLVKSQLVNVPDSTKKDLMKLSKSLSGKIDTLMNLYSPPTEGVQGILDDENVLTSYFWRARSLLSSSQGTPSPNAQHALKFVKSETNKVLTQINEFFETDFTDYQKAVEAVKYSLFKEFVPIKLD